MDRYLFSSCRNRAGIALHPGSSGSARCCACESRRATAGGLAVAGDNILDALRLAAKAQPPALQHITTALLAQPPELGAN